MILNAAILIQIFFLRPPRYNYVLTITSLTTFLFDDISDLIATDSSQECVGSSAI